MAGDAEKVFEQLVPIKRIPRIIHQTWKNGTVPEEFRGWQASWQTHHPGWQYVLWTDDDLRGLIHDHYRQYLDLWDSLPHGGMRADVGRVFVLDRWGGIYADLDYECLASFEPMCDQHTGQVLLLVESPHKQNENLQNSLMICTPGHPFWPRLWEELRVRSASRLSRWGFRGVIGVTGPCVIDHVYNNYAEKAAHGIGVLPKEQYYWGEYARHHQAGSWIWPLAIKTGVCGTAVLGLVAFCLWLVWWVARRARNL